MRRRHIAIACLSIGMLVGQVSGYPGTASAQSSRDAARQVAELRAKLADLKAQAAAATQTYLTEVGEYGDAVSEHISTLQEIDEVRAAEAEEKARKNATLRAAFMYGGQVGLYSSLMESTSPHDLFARYANVRAVVSAAAARPAVSSTIDVLAQTAQELEQNVAAQNRRYAAARSLTSALATAEQEQVRLIAAADATVRALLAREQEEARARLLAAAATSKFGGGPAFAPTPGTRYACPIGNVHSFVDTWGAPRSGGRQHEGTDVFGPYGAPLYAVADGVVDKWGNGGLGGITLWIRADNGDRFYYAHNSVNVAPVGTRVRAGDVVAHVGKTGNAATTPPHLHFETHPGGAGATNPYPFLHAVCST